MIPIVPVRRKAMTPARKARIWLLRSGRCGECGRGVSQDGPSVIYDHRVPLDLGGADEDFNIWPLHRSPCDQLKTAADLRRITKARRIRRRDAEPRRPSTIPSRSFDKAKTRRMNGQVVPRRTSTGASL